MSKWLTGKNFSPIIYDEYSYYLATINYDMQSGKAVVMEGIYLDMIIKYDLKIEHRKTYNGYTIGLYHQEHRKKDAFCDTMRVIMDMTRVEFIDHVKKEFNAVPRNHYSVYFNTNEDAQNAIEWIDSVRLVKKWEREAAFG